jgi:hypothetical protein
VDAVTVRRWVDATPDEVWRRLTDLAGLASDEAELDVLELAGDEGPLRSGSLIVLARHHGPRRSNLAIDVLGSEPASRLILHVEHGRARWVVDVELCPIGRHATDVSIHAQRDPSRPGFRLWEATTGRADQRRLAADLTDLLERLIRRVDTGREQFDVPLGALI